MANDRELRLRLLLSSSGKAADYWKLFLTEEDWNMQGAYLRYMRENYSDRRLAIVFRRFFRCEMMVKYSLEYAFVAGLTMDKAWRRHQVRLAKLEARRAQFRLLTVPGNLYG